jgi:outer membrane lipoprotein SlyB
MHTGCCYQVEHWLNLAGMTVKEIRMKFSLRNPLLIAAAIGLAGPAVNPVLAQSSNQANNNRQVLYEYDGKSYQTLDQCLRAKKKAKARGAIAGAAIAGVGTAILGGNLAESALVAGAGALAGREIGRASAKRC